MKELKPSSRSLTKHLYAVDKPKSKSLSGKEIVEALIAVADEADARFEVEMLQDFWKPFEGHYSRFIRDIAASKGLNERPVYSPHEPISGYGSPHYCRKFSLTRHLSHLDFVDHSLLEKLADEDEIYVINFHIWYATSDSTSYFDSGNLSSVLSDFLLPDGLAEKIGSAYEGYLKFRGLKERSEIEEEIVQLLLPYQINPEFMPLRTLTNTPRDLFHYQDRFFTLQRSCQDEEAIQKNSGCWVDIIWGRGIYTCRLEPLGYIQLNKRMGDSLSTVNIFPMSY